MGKDEPFLGVNNFLNVTGCSFLNILCSVKTGLQSYLWHHSCRDLSSFPMEWVASCYFKCCRSTQPSPQAIAPHVIHLSPFALPTPGTPNYVDTSAFKGFHHCIWFRGHTSSLEELLPWARMFHCMTRMGRWLLAAFFLRSTKSLWNRGGRFCRTIWHSSSKSLGSIGSSRAGSSCSRQSWCWDTAPLLSVLASAL